MEQRTSQERVQREEEGIKVLEPPLQHPAPSLEREEQGEGKGEIQEPLLGTRRRTEDECPISCIDVLCECLTACLLCIGSLAWCDGCCDCCCERCCPSSRPKTVHLS